VGAAQERPLGELLADLSRDASALVRDELALARVEMGEKLARARAHVRLIVAGVAATILGGLTLVACAVLVLVALGVPAWGAALLVGLALASSGTLLALRGLTALRDEDLRPTETLRTMRELITWKRRAS
jgi:hypothetical protein